MRLMALFSLIIGAIVGLIGVERGVELSGVAQICAVFVTSAFAAKTAQKYAEKKDDK